MLLPSDVARLVLGYLHDEGLEQTIVTFVSESSHLKEYATHFDAQVSKPYEGKSLVERLEEHEHLVQLAERSQKDESEKVLNSLWKKLDQTIAQLKYQTLPMDANIAKLYPKQNQRSRHSLNVLRYQQQQQRNAQLQARLQNTVPTSLHQPVQSQQHLSELQQQQGRAVMNQTPVASLTSTDQPLLQSILQQPTQQPVQSNPVSPAVVAQAAAVDPVTVQQTRPVLQSILQQPTQQPVQSNPVSPAMVAQAATVDQVTVQQTRPVLQSILQQPTKPMQSNPVSPAVVTQSAPMDQVNVHRTGSALQNTQLAVAASGTGQPAAQQQFVQSQPTIQTVAGPVVVRAPSVVSQSAALQVGHSSQQVYTTVAPCLATTVPAPHGQTLVQQPPTQPTQQAQAIVVPTGVMNVPPPASQPSDQDMGQSPGGPETSVVSPAVSAHSTNIQPMQDVHNIPPTFADHIESYPQLSTPIKDALHSSKSPRRKTVTPRRRELPASEENLEEEANKAEEQSEDENLAISHFLESLLSNTQLHQKLAENINRAVTSEPNVTTTNPNQPSSSDAFADFLDVHVSDDTVSEIINSTSQDPVFESLFALFDVDRSGQQSDTASGNQKDPNQQSVKKKTNQRGNSTRKAERPRKQGAPDEVIVTQGTQQQSQLNQYVSNNSGAAGCATAAAASAAETAQRLLPQQQESSSQQTESGAVDRIVSTMPMLTFVNENGVRSLRQTHIRNLDFTCYGSANDPVVRRRRGPPSVQEQLDALRARRNNRGTAATEESRRVVEGKARCTKTRHSSKVKRRRPLSKMQLLANANIRIHSAPCSPRSPQVASTQSSNPTDAATAPTGPPISKNAPSAGVGNQTLSANAGSPNSPIVVFSRGNVSVIHHATAGGQSSENSKTSEAGAAGVSVAVGQSVANPPAVVAATSCTTVAGTTVTAPPGESSLSSCGRSQSDTAENATVSPEHVSTEHVMSPHPTQTPPPSQTEVVSEQQGDHLHREGETNLQGTEQTAEPTRCQNLHEPAESSEIVERDVPECYEPVDQPPSVANEEVVEMTEDTAPDEEPSLEQNETVLTDDGAGDALAVSKGNKHCHGNQTVGEREQGEKDTAVPSQQTRVKTLKILVPTPKEARSGLLSTRSSDHGKVKERSSGQRSSSAVENTTGVGERSDRGSFDAAESLVRLSNIVLQAKEAYSEPKESAETPDRLDRETDSGERGEGGDSGKTVKTVKSGDGNTGACHNLRSETPPIECETSKRIHKGGRSERVDDGRMKRKRDADRTMDESVSSLEPQQGQKRPPVDDIHHGDSGSTGITKKAKSDARFPSNMDVDKFLSKLYYTDS